MLISKLLSLEFILKDVFKNVSVFLKLYWIIFFSYRIYSRTSQEILDKIWVMFFNSNYTQVINYNYPNIDPNVSKLLTEKVKTKIWLKNLNFGYFLDKKVHFGSYKSIYGTLLLKIEKKRFTNNTIHIHGLNFLLPHLI